MKAILASAVLGTVGAGGIGYVISNCMTRYATGQAIVAIVMAAVYLYRMELTFTAVKEKNGKSRWRLCPFGGKHRDYQRYWGTAPKETIEALGRPGDGDSLCFRYPQAYKDTCYGADAGNRGKADFFLGELLACEALVEVEGQRALP